LASATDRELWQGPKAGSLRITDFRLSVQPQKFETTERLPSVAKMGSYCACTLSGSPPDLSICGAGQEDLSSGDENGISSDFFQREVRMKKMHKMSP